MTKNKQRNRWRLLTFGVVVIIVLALVIAAAILLTGSPNSTASRTNGAPGISLEEWLSGSLSPKSFNGTWISGKHTALLFVNPSRFCVSSVKESPKRERQSEERVEKENENKAPSILLPADRTFGMSLSPLTPSKSNYALLLERIWSACGFIRRTCRIRRGSLFNGRCALVGFISYAKWSLRRKSAD